MTIENTKYSLMEIKLDITDDSGFIAIANPDKYLSFVNEKWNLPQLLNHFINQMNKQAFIIWATGMQNMWTVIFRDKPSNQKAFREFSKSILVTNGELFLTNYEDLTMSAQFKDVKIPANHNSNLCIKLDNGVYNFLVRQMFDPENYNYGQEEKNDFEVIIEVGNNEPSIELKKVFWWTN